jgi:hypothetical protein
MRHLGQVIPLLNLAEPVITDRDRDWVVLAGAPVWRDVLDRCILPDAGEFNAAFGVELNDRRDGEPVNVMALSFSQNRALDGLSVGRDTAYTFENDIALLILTLDGLLFPSRHNHSFKLKKLETSLD